MSIKIYHGESESLLSRNLECNTCVQCVHYVLVSSFENGADVWFVHLKGRFADLNIPKISLNICRQMAFF